MLNQALPQIYLIVASLGFLIATLIIAARNHRRQGALMLSTFIAIQSSGLLVEWLEWRASDLHALVFPYAEIIVGAGYCLLGPLLYQFTAAMIAPNQSLTLRHMKHAATAIILGGSFPLWVSEPGQFMLITLIGVAIYNGFSLRKIHNYHSAVSNEYSTLDAHSLNWLRKILICCMVCSLTLLVVMLLVVLKKLDMVQAHLLLRGWNFCLFFLIALAGIRSGLLSFGHTAESRHQAPGYPPRSTNFIASLSDNQEKYKNSRLDRETAHALWQHVNAYMESQQPFLDSDLKMTDLAKATGISAHDLSQTINTVSGESFHTYVNGFRIRAAQALIKTDALHNVAMVDIAIRAGFASKATFYKHFKQHFGMTPAAYKKRVF